MENLYVLSLSLSDEKPFSWITIQHLNRLKLKENFVEEKENQIEVRNENEQRHNS